MTTTFVPRNTQQKIAELQLLGNFTITTDFVAPFTAEAILYTCPIDKKAKIDGVYTVDSISGVLAFHAVEVRKPLIPIDELMLKWVITGNSDTFSPLNMAPKVGIESAFLLLGGQSLFHNILSTVGGISNTLTVNANILELPA